MKNLERKHGLYKFTVEAYPKRIELVKAQKRINDQFIEFAETIEKEGIAARYFEVCSRRTNKQKTKFLTDIYLPKFNIAMYQSRNEEDGKRFLRQHPTMGVIMLRKDETIDFWLEKLHNVIQNQLERFAKQKELKKPLKFKVVKPSQYRKRKKITKPTYKKVNYENKERMA